MLIEREALLKTLKDLGWLSDTPLEDIINEVPTIEAVAVQHGRWIFEDDNGAYPWTTKAICSVCKEVVDWNASLSVDTMQQNYVEANHYCPNCGAKMDDDMEQSNNPLTIEELRQMNGQPVWCEDINEWGIVKIETIGRWANNIFLIGHYGNDQVRTNFEYDVEMRGMKLYKQKPTKEV